MLRMRRLVISISLVLALGASAYAQSQVNPDFAHLRLQIEARVWEKAPTTAVLQFPDTATDEDLNAIQVPGNLKMLFWESGFWTVENPHSTIAENLRLIRQDVIQSGIDEGTARACCHIIGIKLQATPRQILNLLDTVPGSEVRYLDGPARSALNLYPRGKESRRSRSAEHSITLPNNQLAAQEANPQPVRFLPTRGSLKIEDITDNGKLRRRVTGEFYWDSDADMSSFRLSDFFGNTDAYEHQIVFKVHDPFPPNGVVLRPDDADSPLQKAPYGFFLGSILSANADPTLPGGWPRNFVAIQGFNELGAGTDSELDFTIGSYSAKSTFVPGHWYRFTITTEPGSYISKFTAVPPDSTPPSLLYTPLEITPLNSDVAKLSGQKITNHRNNSDETPFDVYTDPLFPGPDITCFISGSVPCPIPQPHAPTFVIPVGNMPTWTWGKPKPQFSIQPFQSPVSVSAGATTTLRFVVTNNSGSDDPITIHIDDKGQCGGNAVGLVGIVLKPLSSSSFTFECQIPLGTTVVPSQFKISATAAGVDATGTLQIALVPPSPFSVTCTANPPVVNEGQSSKFVFTAAGGIPPYTYIWSQPIKQTVKTSGPSTYGKTYATAGDFSARATVTDSSITAQPITQSCTVTVNPVTPSANAPGNLSLALASTPLTSLPFSALLSGSGFTIGALQVWFFGATTCLDGCRQPDAGVSNVTAVSATLVNVRLASDTYRVRARNGDTGPWSAASAPFQVQAGTVPNFDLTTLNGTKSVQAGQPVSFDFGLSPKNGFSGVVTWQIAGLPAGVSVTNVSQQVNLSSNGATFSANIQTGYSTPVGTYPVVLTATGGTVFQSLNLTLSITAAPATPTITKFTIVGTAQVGTLFGLNIVGTGFISGSLQVWFFGTTSCQTGCQQPSAGVSNVTATAATVSQVFLAAGDFHIKLRNTDTGQFSNDSSLLTVQAAPAPDFSLGTLAATKSVQAGQATGFDMGITSTNGFTGLMNWQLSGLPTGVSITNASQQINVTSNGTTFTINLQSQMTTFPNTYSLTFTATSGSLAHTLPLTLIVTPVPLSGSCMVNGQGSPLTLQVGNQATFVINTNGGTQPLHYLWSGINGNDSNSALQIYSSPGTYNVSAVVSDSTPTPQQINVSCPSVTVQPPPPVSAFCNISPNPINIGGGATLSAGALGGTSPYQFLLPGSRN